MSGVAEQARAVLLDPAEFFRAIPRDDGPREPLPFLLAMAAASALAEVLVGLAFHRWIPGLLFGAVASLVMIPVLCLVGSGVAHIFWAVLGSRQPFETSFRCMAYLSVIFPLEAAAQSLPGLASWTVFLPLAYSAYLFFHATTEAHGISRTKALVAISAPWCLFALVAAGSMYGAWRLSRSFAKNGNFQMTTMRSAMATGLAAHQAQERQADAMLGAMMGLMGAGPQARPTDPEKLKVFLPASLPRFTRVDVQKNRQRSGSADLVSLRGVYAGKDGGQVAIDLLDAGAYGPMLALSVASGNFDRTSASGFKRTISRGEARGFEEYDNASRSGSIQLILGQRFLIKSAGRDVDFSAIRSGADALDLRAIAQLAP